MICRLKQHRTSEEMSESLNYFQELLGDEMYKKLFGLLLIDRGSEFAKPELFEVNTQNRKNQKQYILLRCTNAKSETTCVKQS